MRFLFVGSHLCTRASFRQILADLPLPSASGYLQQSPEVVEKVVAALIESTAFGISPVNKSIVLDTIMKTFKVADTIRAEEAYQRFSRATIRKPYPSAERMRDIQRVMAHHDPRVLNVRVEDLIEDRFVRKLDASGVIDRIYNSYRSGS